MRYNAKDVREAFDALCREAFANGIDVSTWELREGTASVGRPYALIRRAGSGTANLWFAVADGDLGMSAREAVRTLHVYRAGMYAARSKVSPGR